MKSTVWETCDVRQSDSDLVEGETTGQRVGVDLVRGVEVVGNVVVTDSDSDGRRNARPDRCDGTTYAQIGPLLQVNIAARLDR